jgi:hypothetical protein
LGVFPSIVSPTAVIVTDPDAVAAPVLAVDPCVPVGAVHGLAEMAAATGEAAPPPAELPSVEHADTASIAAQPTTAPMLFHMEIT